MRQDQNFSVINYTMFEDSDQFVGLANVTLPSLEMITKTVTGAGIAGELEAVLIGQMKAMNMEIQMLTLTRQGIRLSEQRVHNWELREAQQGMDGATKVQTVEAVKHVVRAFPKKMDGGTLSPQSASNPRVSAAVYYWAEYRNGEKALELDPVNYICFMNGKDYLEPVRKALGL